jgi:predicted O-methyltransferase YrrM
MIKRASTILGWMTEAELWWLAVQSSNRRKILELGSYYGRSTRAMADNTPGVVYAVDNFKGPTEVAMFDFERSTIKTIFDKNLADHIASGKVIVVDSDHSDYDPPIDDFDMVFIDGDHTYEPFKRDLTRWLGKTRLPYLMSGHDIDHPEVKQVVDEVFAGKTINTFGGIWNVWIS